MSKPRRNILQEVVEQAPASAPDARKRKTPLTGIAGLEGTGPVSAVSKALDSLTTYANRAVELEERLSKSEAILEIDPALIDPSFARDRMAAFDPEGTDAEFVGAIRNEGQLVPALLRPNPTAPGRFQPAYGRRRIAAAAFLSRKVRAVVRELSDEQLVVAQGQENEARNGLTFIEKCRFAATLEAQGFKRKVIESALTTDKTRLGEMIRVADTVPSRFVDWVGAAPSIGRRKWLALADICGVPDNLERGAAFLDGQKSPAGDFSSDGRFEALLQALSEVPSMTKPASTQWALPGQKKPYGSIDIAPRRITLVFDRSANPAIADALIERVEAFRRELEAAASTKQP